MCVCAHAYVRVCVCVCVCVCVRERERLSIDSCGFGLVCVWGKGIEWCLSFAFSAFKVLGFCVCAYVRVWCVCGVCV